MKKHGLVIFLWLFALAAGGYLLYHEIVVNKKTVYLEESLFLMVIAFLSICGVYYLLKKGASVTVIKMIFLAAATVLILITSLFE